MASRKLKKRILAGSLNLLPPGDLLPPEDALEMQNFRVDQAGNIRSRKGSFRLNPIALEGSVLGAIHTLGPRAAPAFYAGALTELYRDGGSVLPLPPRRRTGPPLPPFGGSFAFVQIATGFDGQPIGVAPSQNFAWFMNQKKQGKDNGSTFYNWLPDPPLTKVDVAVGARQFTTLATFDPAEAWVTHNVEGAPTPVFDSTIAIQGAASLKLEVIEATTDSAYAELPISMDLGIDGQQREDDKLEVWVHISDPKQIENLHFFVDVNDGTFGQDYYICTFPRDFFTAFNPAGEAWNQLEMYRKLPEGDVTTRFGFRRVGDTPGKDWSTAKAIRVQADIRGSVTVRFDEWFMFGGIEGPIEGEQIQYYVTFDTAEGHESNPGPASTAKAFNKQAATLTNIPVSGDPQVTVRHIYRAGGTLSQVLRAFTINDNVTATAVDKNHDDILTDLGIELEADHDPPPPAAGLAGEFFNRLLAFRSIEHLNRLWFTKPNRPWYFPDSDSKAPGDNAVDVGDAGEMLLAVSLHKRMAICYKAYSIWRLLGDPADGQLEQTNANIGIIGPLAWANAGAVDYIASDEGVYRFNGDFEEKVSLQIDPIFKGQHTSIAIGVSIPPMSRQYRSNTVLAYANGRLWLSYPEDGQEFPNVVLILDTESGRWARHKLGTGGVALGYRALYYDSRSAGLFGATTTGLILRAEDGGSRTDAGAAIPLAYHSGYQDVGLPDNEKTFSDLVVEHNTSDAVLTVKVYYDNGKTEEALGSIWSNTGARERSVYRINTGQGHRALNVAVRFEGNASSEVVIYAIYLHYYAEARPAKSWDTDEFAPAAGRLVEAKEVQFDLEATGEATFQVLTDYPGNAMTSRASKPVQPTGGRRNVQVPFTTVEGRLYRLLLHGDATIGPSSSPGLFRLHAARMLVRAIGVFVEGYEADLGFVWDSTEVDFGTHLVKAAKSLLLELDTEGAIGVNLHSDLPGNDLALRRLDAVNTTVTTAGRRIFKVPFPNAGIEGRLFRLRITGSQTYKLFRAALEVRPIGVYVEAYEALAGADWDSTELDLGIREVKECRQLELDIDTDAAISAFFYSDLPGQNIVVRETESPNTEATTRGRRKVNLPLGALGASGLGILGRLLRLVLVGGVAWRLYGARLWLRPYGWYIEAEEATGGALYDSAEVDFGTQKVKDFREFEFDYASDRALTLRVYTDLPGNAMVERMTYTLPAAARRTIQIAVPSRTEGRLVRLTLGTSAAYQLYAARAQCREIGVYVERYEGVDGLLWDSTELDLGVPGAKELIELRFDLDSDAWLIVRVYTDLPGEAMVERWNQHINTETTTTGRRTIFVPLPQFTEGRLVRITLEGYAAYRLYEGAIRFRAFGHYLNGDSGSGRLPASTKIWRTLDMDLGTERVKILKELEIQADTDGSVEVRLYTDLPGEAMTMRVSRFIDSTGKPERSRNFKIRLPGNIKGRLVAAEIHATSTVRLYGMRLRMKTVGEVGQSNWTWVDLPVEKTPDFPSWAPLPVEPTPPAWEWKNLPLPATPELLSWVDLPVLPTPPGWEFRDFPVEATPDHFSWIEIPVDVVE